MQAWLASLAAILIEKLITWAASKLWDWVDQLVEHKKIDKAVDDAKESGDTSELERILIR